MTPRQGSWIAGSIPARRDHSPVAQLVEQDAVNIKVPDSSSGGGVRENKVHTCKYLRSSALLRQQKGRQGDWRSGSAAPRHGEGRPFNPDIAHYYTQSRMTDPVFQVFFIYVCLFLAMAIVK